MSLSRRDKSQQSLAGAARFAAACACLLAVHCGAHGQVSGSVALASEVSARGVSLSDGRTAPQLSVSYDAATGWYAGASAAPRLTVAGRTGVTRLVAYAGYARRLPSGLSWDAGASSTSFTHLSGYNYREIFLGLASDRLSGRLYFSPEYYGYRGRAAYLELTGFHPVGERIKLIVQAGVLHGLKGLAADTRDRVDTRLAISYDAGQVNVQLAWLRTASIGSGVFRTGERAPRALAASVSYSF